MKYLFLLVTILYSAFPNWFYKIKDIKKQKKVFVKIIFPLIEKENKKILILREKVIDTFNDPFFLLDIQKISFLAKIAKKYKINSLNKEKFLKKIDIIPPSLALSQAAIESAWGKSRFVKEANNIFGHWTYSNKGIKPKDKFKDINITYSIRKFNSIEDSISAYMLNLNRNKAYKKFRNLRFEYRKNGKIFTGLVAADTMYNYSKLKDKYVKMLKKIIISNKFEKFDKERK